MKSDLHRYDRQILLPEIGLSGQAKLRSARVLCVGAGGLGAPAALYLAAAGVGSISILDDDRVDVSNLHRQILFKTTDVGRFKAEASRDHLLGLNPDISIAAITTRITAENAMELLKGVDVVVDGSDNFETKFLLNDAAIKAGNALVYGSIYRFEGQVSVFNATKSGPCYRCLYPEPPKQHIPNCSETGVLGSIAGIVGTIQATEAIKVILGHAELKPLVGSLLQINARDMEITRAQFSKNPHCRTCSKTVERIDLEDYSLGGEELLRDEYFARCTVIDVREREEWRSGHLPGALHLPYSSLENAKSIPALSDSKPVILYCQRGIRSQNAVKIFRQFGLHSARTLRGGIESWSGPIVKTSG